MQIPNNFICLLIKGNPTEKEAEHIKNVYNEYGSEKIEQLIAKKKIVPFAAKTFCECEIETDKWQKVFDEYRKRNLNIINFLDIAYKSLHKHGVKKMFVSENFGALLSCDGDIGLFTSGDVDNFAPITEKDNIYKAMEAIGCTIKERFAVNNQIAAEFFPPESFNLPEKFYLSVDFYPLARLKLPCFINEKDFVDWDLVSFYKNTEITLAPFDALMYICMLHISLHSFSRAPDMRLYIDLLNMTKLDIDYTKIASWCEKDNTCTRAAVASEISNRLMNTNIPKEITDLCADKDRLLKKVYDAEKNDLIYEPHGLKVLVIEALCDDKSIAHGILNIMYPDKEWMIKTYGDKGIKAWIKHIIRTL